MLFFTQFFLSVSLQEEHLQHKSRLEVCTPSSAKLVTESKKSEKLGSLDADPFIFFQAFLFVKKIIMSRPY